MGKYRYKMGPGAVFYVPRIKRPIAQCTVATRDFLTIIHSDHPNLTISQLRDMLTNPDEYIPAPEAVDVLDAHIKAGYGDYIPTWE